jgi:hypothetical protein
MKTSMKQMLLVSALLYVIAVPALAQTSAGQATTVAVAGDPSVPLPDAPAPATTLAAGRDASMPLPLALPAYNDRPPIPVAIPVMDKGFVIGNSVMLGTTIANTELVLRCLPNHYCNDVPVDLRGRKRLYAVALPTNLGVGVLGYYLKRGGHRWWFVPAALISTGNIVYGIHAAQHVR